MNVGFWISRDSGRREVINISSEKPEKMNDVGMWVTKEPYFVLADVECLATFNILPYPGSCEYYVGVIKRTVE